MSVFSFFPLIAQPYSTVTTCTRSVLEMFGCVLETAVKTSPDHFHWTWKIGRVSSDRLNAQRRERHLCSYLTSGFWMKQLHFKKVQFSIKLSIVRRTVTATTWTFSHQTFRACWSIKSKISMSTVSVPVNKVSETMFTVFFVFCLFCVFCASSSLTAQNFCC